MQLSNIIHKKVKTSLSWHNDKKQREWNVKLSLIKCEAHIAFKGMKFMRISVNWYGQNAKIAQFRMYNVEYLFAIETAYVNVKWNCCKNLTKKCMCSK